MLTAFYKMCTLPNMTEKLALSKNSTMDDAFI